MSRDSRNQGLDELGQRMQAMSDPVPEPRLRPYQGAPPPAPPASNGRSIPPYEAYKEFRVTPVPQQPSQPTPPSYATQPFRSDPFPNPTSTQIPTPIRDTSPRPVPASAWENVAATGHEVPPYPGVASGYGIPQAPAAPALPIDPNAPKSGIQRAIDVVRSTLPLVQRLLPLLDGNFATAIGALVAPQSHPHPASQPQPQPQTVHVDLEPVERGLAEVRNSHRELRGQVVEQVTNLKRVEDQLERVREATDRNTLEQQELVEDLRSVGSRISTFAIIGVVLLAISLGLNIYFLVQLQHILR